MGSRGQKLIRPIEGLGEAQLEMIGFVYKNKETSKFHFKVELSGNIEMRGINYTIKYLGTMNKPLNNLLYRSEIIDPRTSKNLNFNKSKIPDIYLAPDLNLDNNNIEISLFNSFYNKNIGKYSGPLSKLLNNGAIVQIGQGRTAFFTLFRYK